MFAIDDDKMKLYNFLFDEHPNTNDLLQYIGFTKTDISRFRDVCIQKKGIDWYIIIFNRTGGKNRRNYNIEIGVFPIKSIF